MAHSYRNCRHVGVGNKLGNHPWCCEFWALEVLNKEHSGRIKGDLINTIFSLVKTEELYLDRHKLGEDFPFQQWIFRLIKIANAQEK